MSEQFEIDQISTILRNEPDLNIEFKELGFVLIPNLLRGDSYYLNDYGYSKLAEYYLENSQIIISQSVVSLANMTGMTSDIWNVIVLSTPYAPLSPPFSFTNSRLAELIFYAFKYSSVKMFFRENYKFFLPEFDYEMINSQEKIRLFQEAFMREFDKFAMITGNLYDIVDIDKIPFSYLNYIAQLIGYQRSDYLLLKDFQFRELLKNIIEIYKIKGTNYSFELFFNLLGFEIIPQEFWFDKRFGDSGIAINPYTSSTSKNSYLFYMTPNKPSDVIPSGMFKPYAISQDQIKVTKDLTLFNQLTEKYLIGDSLGYSYTQLLGNTTYNFPYKLEGYWPLNLGSGDTGLDLSGNKRHLLNYNTIWKIGGVKNSPAIFFQNRGDTKFLITDSNINFSNNKEMSITFYARKNQIGDSAIFYPFSFGKLNIDGIFLFAKEDGSGSIVFNRVSSSDSFSFPVGTFDSQLRFYSLVFSNVNKRFTFYKNSVKVIDTNVTSSIIMPNRKLVVGNSNNFLPSNGWLGLIDEINLYSRVLSEFEVKQLFNPFGDSYSYFKTNIIQYSISSLATGQEADLTTDDLAAIEFYAEFLSPIFVTRNILFQAKKNIESGSASFGLTDCIRTDPIYINRPGGITENRTFSIQSILVSAGDTFNPRGKVIVSDPVMNLIDFIHPTADSRTRFALDRIEILGTGAVSNDGYYQIAGDTIPPFYSSSTKTTTIYLKGDTLTGIHGTDKITPNGYLYIGGPDKMFHLYEGKPPKRYYADSGLIADTKPAIGGNFISGFYINSKEILYGLDDSTSAYYRLKNLNPTFSEEQVFALMANYISGGDTGYITLGAKPRDWYNIIDSTRNMKSGHYSFALDTGDTRPTGDSWVIYRTYSSKNNTYGTGDSKVWWRHGGWLVPVTRSTEQIVGNSITLGANFSLLVFDTRPKEKYLTNYNSLKYLKGDTLNRISTGQIISLQKNNGSNQGVIKVLDRRRYDGDSAINIFPRIYDRLMRDDYISLFETTDPSNRNTTYKIFSTSFYGDSTTITVTTTLNGSNQLISNGYISEEFCRKIKSLTRNVSSKGRIILFDGTGLFNGLKSGDTIIISNTGDSNVGVYIADSVGFARLAGDSGVTTIMTTTTLKGGLTGDSKGIVKLNSLTWNLLDRNYQFMYDKVNLIKTY